MEIVPIGDFMSTALGHLFWFGVYMCHCIYSEQITENIMWLIKSHVEISLASDLPGSCFYSSNSLNLALILIVLVPLFPVVSNVSSLFWLDWLFSSSLRVCIKSNISATDQFCVLCFGSRQRTSLHIYVKTEHAQKRRQPDNIHSHRRHGKMLLINGFWKRDFVLWMNFDSV